MVENSTVKTGYIGRGYDCLVTFICWSYFIFSFLFFFSFFYLTAFFFARNREYAFQYLDHLFFKGFLSLLRILTPCHKWEVATEISAMRGSIIVCNHLSYLDPLLFISLLPRQKTIVKTKFFKVPVFGWLVDVSGYIPSTTEGVYAKKMIEQVENMGGFFRAGGNLFVFPEGTRNSGAKLGEFHKGVFKIARMYKCPIHVLHLCNTEKLFAPGKFLFNARVKNCISMKILVSIDPAVAGKRVSAKGLEKEVRQIFERNTRSGEGDG